MLLRAGISLLLAGFVCCNTLLSPLQLSRVGEDYVGNVDVIYKDIESPASFIMESNSIIDEPTRDDATITPTTTTTTTPTTTTTTTTPTTTTTTTTPTTTTTTTTPTTTTTTTTTTTPTTTTTTTTPTTTTTTTPESTTTHLPTTPTPTEAPPPTPQPIRYTAPLNVPTLGSARGKIMTSFLGRDFYAYQSIPYALPPVGDKRFRYPELWTLPWTMELDDGSYDASYLRDRCVQSSYITSGFAGSEDCLHVSIYTPQKPNETTEMLPVMYWIHGGAFMSGDSFLYVPTKLMDRDVVVVTVQYRLASLGFLAAGIEEAPGNMGLMDQVMGLRWVQKYIHFFGGNADSVTVFGQSAGGASSSWMQMTPLTNGSSPNNDGHDLLHKVIPQSGSALEIWTLDQDPDGSFYNYAEIVNCRKPDTSKQQIVECMKKLSYKEIVAGSYKVYRNDRINGGLGFRGLCPVVQTELTNSGIELVIPKQPTEILELGEFLRVPVMTGSVRDEGSLVVGLLWDGYLVPNELYTNNTEFLRDHLIDVTMKAFGIQDTSGSVANSMQLAYLRNAIMGKWDSMVGGLVDMTGVMFLKSGMWTMLHHIKRAAPELKTFFYSWEFESDDTLFTWMFATEPEIPVSGGVSHADELLYLFHLPGIMDEREKKMSQRMLTLWTNFAKYGNPTPDNVTGLEDWRNDMPLWTPFEADTKPFMLIQDELTISHDFTKRWNYNTQPATSATKIASPTPSADEVDLLEYMATYNETDQFKVATGVLAGLLGCVLIVCGFLVYKNHGRSKAV